MERPLRLITANPVDRLARTIEALLVVAVAAALGGGAGGGRRRRRRAGRDGARRSSAERYREGRSGIVLERVAGGYAFRASREAAEACARLFERPVAARAVAGGARDARDRRLPRPVQPPGDRADPRRRRRLGRRRARRARADRRGGSRRGARRRGALPDDAAVRAGVRARAASRSCRASTTSATTRTRSASGSRRSRRTAASRRSSTGPAVDAECGPVRARRSPRPPRA